MKGWTSKDVENIKSSKSVKLPTIKTNALTQAALRILIIKGYNVWRNNNGGVYDAKFKGYRANSSTPGISDILGYHKHTGQIIACEIKAGKDKLSAAQTIFLNDVNNAGGIGVVVRCLEDLETIKL